MKKKSPRDIPDFSRHAAPQKGLVGPRLVKEQKPVVTRPPAIKPQSTSAKSGRRGG
jgi:hypothetical protein